MKVVLAATALLTTVMTTAHSADAESAPTATEALADEAGVDAVDLRGAANSTGLTPRRYLQAVGELVASDALARGVSEDGGRASQAAPVSALSGVLACIARVESHNNPGATNRYSGAAGLFQFLPSTWSSTPQGRAGLSPYDPDAATAAAIWMIDQGRIREWVAVTGGWC